MNDTIFALSSGAPPAAIAVIRISGPLAGEALMTLAGTLPQSRTASLRSLRAPDGALLDRALVLWFPGVATATGEALAELHLHGGRAVVRAVEGALDGLPGLRRAEPGEFTRRAFANGRMDLAEAEGLADLLTAETELQRQQALSLASGSLSARTRGWREAVLVASAAIEAMLDFGDEDDIQHLPVNVSMDLQALADDLGEMLNAPRAEVLRDGFRVVLAGPPNSGKSSLFNRLVEEEAAITAPIAGTTRDVLTRPVSLSGIPFVFVDTAGLRETTDDTIEAMGIGRAQNELERADLVLWLGAEGQGGGKLIWEIESFADLPSPLMKRRVRHRISVINGNGLSALIKDLIDVARRTMPLPGAIALNARQHDLLARAHAGISSAAAEPDLLIASEGLRCARLAFDKLLGHTATDDMLDTLFSRFCIGK